MSRWMVVLFMTAAATAVAAPPARGQVRPDSTHTPPTALSPSPGGMRLDFGDYMLRDRLGVGTPNYLTANLDVTSMQWYRTPTRFEAVMNGAGTAATLGMFLGALGTTFGWFDEEASWWVTGSMAAAGALYGGMKYQPQPPGLRYRIGVDREPDTGPR